MQLHKILIKFIIGFANKFPAVPDNMSASSSAPNWPKFYIKVTRLLDIKIDFFLNTVSVISPKLLQLKGLADDFSVL